MPERSYSFEPTATHYRIGDGIVLNTHANTITNGEKVIELENRLVLLLVYFIHHQGEVLPKDLLLKTIWQGKVVNDDSLSVAVSHIRKALGDSSRAPQFIKTLPGVGYQFIGAAEAMVSAETALPQTVANKSKRYGFWAGVASVLLALVLIGFYVSRSTTAVATTANHLNEATNKQLQEAHQLLISEDSDNWRQAIKIYRNLIDHQGDIAEAYTGIAEAKMKLLGEQIVVKENCIEVVGLLQKAVALDPQSSRAHKFLANAMFWGQRDYANAEQHYTTAIKLDPNDDEVAIFYSEYLLSQKRFEESLAEVERARRLNPLKYSVPVVVWIYQMQGRDDLALRELNRILTTEPDNRYFHISAQRIFNRMGDAEKTFAQWKWLMKDSGYSDDALAEAQQKFDHGGLPEFNRWLLARKETADLGNYSPPLSWARYALVAGDYEQALNYLEQAYDKRQIPLLWAEVDPAYAPVHDTPRFQKILAQLKLAENK